MPRENGPYPGGDAGRRPCPSDRDWVAPLFRDTAVATEHGKDARRSPRKPSLAWRLTQHNRRAEPTPTITVTRRAGVTSWKRTCKAYRFSHITYPGHPLHPENVSSNPNYFLFCLFTSYSPPHSSNTQPFELTATTPKHLSMTPCPTSSRVSPPFFF